MFKKTLIRFRMQAKKLLLRYLLLSSNFLICVRENLFFSVRRHDSSPAVDRSFLVFNFQVSQIEKDKIDSVDERSLSPAFYGDMSLV